MPRMMILDSETFVVLHKQEYHELLARAHRVSLPEYPPADKAGRRHAGAFGRASLAREIITRRLAAEWTQAALAEASGVRVETISRLESAKHHPQRATLNKIERALQQAGA